MSKIEDLIKELCADGVVYTDLGCIASVETGSQLNKTSMTDVGEYPVLNGGINPSGFYHLYNTDDQSIAISQGGASAGYVNFMEVKFWAGAHCFVVKPTSATIINKYLYYILKNDQKLFMNAKLGAGIPGLNKKELTGYQVPLPPLPIQQEIVSILDNFTKLEAELEAELEARKKQYEYYRNQLLSPIEKDGKWYMNGKEVEWRTLGDVCTFQYGKPLKEAQRNNGNFPVIGSNGVVGYHDEFYVKAPSIVIGRKGSAGAINWIDQDCYPIDTTFHLLLKTNAIQLRFLYHYLMQIDLKPETQSGGVPGLNRNDAYRKEIPIPPLSEQERIVSILDRFDALVNDISIGLPAEIEARRKQYEYYRGKLLSFKNIADRAEA